MREDEFQPDGMGRRVDNRGGGHLQVFCTAAQPIRKLLYGGQTIYLEGDSDVEISGETLEA